MNYKPLFSRSLAAAPDRLHMAAHSHHLWPDASFAGQMQAWEDAAALADHKWDKVMGEVWPEAQGHVARELGLPDPATIAFSSNTHDFIIRLVSATARRPLRVLASDGEFHSFRRQATRWEESGAIQLETVPTGPDFADRFVETARQGDFGLIFVSQVMFGSGQLFDRIEALAALAKPIGPWVVVDGYHGFMAVETDLSAVANRIFYLGGGYKYAMAGEGAAFLHAPPAFAARPEVTGWFAAFDELERGEQRIGFAPDGRRFLGATFDPSGLYRFNAVRRMLADEGLDTAAVNRHVDALRQQLVEGLGATALGRAELLNPPSDGGQARFLAFRSGDAQAWHDALARREVITDVRGDVLRIGLALYHDEEDVERFCDVARDL